MVIYTRKRQIYTEPEPELVRGVVSQTQARSLCASSVKPEVSDIANVKANEIKSDREQVAERKAEEPKASEIAKDNESFQENDYHKYLKANRKSVKPLELRDNLYLFDCDELYGSYLKYCDEVEEPALSYRNFKQMFIKSPGVKFSQRWFQLGEGSAHGSGSKRRNCYSIRKDWFVDQKK